MSEDQSKGKTVERTIPDPEVKLSESNSRRRRYLTPRYKLRVLMEADGCKDNTGELGALLRREGLYSSHVSAWRRERDQGKLTTTSKIKRGRKQSLSVAEAA
jgi:transposase